jgi:beta-N-acetylhexosaminidase
LEAPVDHRSWQQLLDHDLKPFIELSQTLDGVMPAHITFPEVDPDSVGFSPFWLKQILRKQLGFEGVIFSDDLTMKGADVAGGFVDKAKLALDAGCDMILVCNCPEGALEVLRYMESQDVKGSDRIASMAAQMSVDWHQLVENPRRIKTIKLLETLSDGKL